MKQFFDFFASRRGETSAAVTAQSKEAGSGGWLRWIFDRSDSNFEAVLRLIERNQQELDSRFKTIKTYTDHYGGILETEEVSPQRLGNMRAILSRHIASARKTMLSQRDELVAALSNCSGLSEEQTQLVRDHNDRVDEFLDNLPEVQNGDNTPVYVEGRLVGVLDEDGKLQPISIRPAVSGERLPPLLESNPPATIEGDFRTLDN